MRQRNRKRLLWLTNAALMACVAAAAAGAFLPLDEAASNGPLRGPDQDAMKSAGDKPIQPLSDYAVIYQRDLRNPLFDAAPVKVVAGPSAPSLKVRLTGTVVEPGFSYGLFLTPTGQLRLVTIGGVIEAAEVVAITERSATLRYQGRLVTLTAEKREPKR